jgi:Asp-tRNA(Asn)/Glu-tRNA(Gln) amidotransferase A subunit family amidase
MPACRAGLYALKPTRNIVYMNGVFKTSAELDVVGGMARSASDLALLSYCALTQEKQDLLPMEGYHKYLTKNFDSLRIGFLDPTKWSLHPDIVQLDQVILQQMVRLRYIFLVFASTEELQERHVRRNGRPSQGSRSRDLCGVSRRPASSERSMVRRARSD